MYFQVLPGLRYLQGFNRRVVSSSPITLCVISHFNSYCQNVQCFDHCSTLEFAVKAREETDIVESREEIKRDVTAIGSHAVPVVWNPPPTFNGDLVSCIQDCNRACAKNSGYKWSVLPLKQVISNTFLAPQIQRRYHVPSSAGFLEPTE